MPPTVPINHSSGPQTNKRGLQSSFIIPCCDIQALACLEHFIFFKVKRRRSDTLASTSPSTSARNGHELTPTPNPPRPPSDYELFNCNNFNIRYWSWNYRGCWHQTCPPIVTRTTIYPALIPIAKPFGPASLFSVTTSLPQDWVICAPAAFLGCGSHFSGSLSGIEP